MADKLPQTDKTNPKQRRAGKTGETVRERMLKAQSGQRVSDVKQPSALSTFGRGFAWPLRQAARPFRRLGRFLGRFRVFRIIGKILLPSYIRSSWRELRQVTWPDRRTSWKLTYAVIVFSIIFGVIVFVVDFVLDKLFKELIIK